jgi:hypothetical protein
MSLQVFEPLTILESVPGIVESIDVKFESGLTLTLNWSGDYSPTTLTFERAKAFTSHDEMSHPDVDAEYPPIGTGRYPDGACPALVVRNSIWLASFPASMSWEYDDHVHYRFISSQHIVDVLAKKPPELQHGAA